MIGFYDYTVLLTYLSVAFSVVGIMNATSGKLDVAVICLLLAGICDGFDGKVARLKKNRTEQQKMFGIQIDSLCDVISFGLFPVILVHNLGMSGAINAVIRIAYVLAAVIRLAYYNVMEAESLRETEHTRCFFQGLPVTSIAIILPIIYFVHHVILGKAFDIGLSIVMAAIAVCFILDVKIKKPSLKLVIMSAITSLVLISYPFFHFCL